MANLAAAIFLQHPPVDVRSIRETRDKRAGSTGGGMDAVLEGLSSDQDQVGVWGRVGGGGWGWGVGGCGGSDCALTGASVDICGWLYAGGVEMQW